MKKNLIFIVGLCLFFSSCAEFVGHRSFVDEMERESDGFFVPDSQFEIITGDKGKGYRSRAEIMRRTPISGEKGPYGGSERNNIFASHYLAQELEYKEGLLTLGEYEVYREHLDIFPSISEKIYYLNLPEEERREYLDVLKRKFMRTAAGRSLASTPATLSLREQIWEGERQRGLTPLELKVGMDKSQIIDEWGKPIKVDIAGNPQFENEKWVFYGPEGTSYIYFEGGKVQGWSLP